MASVSGERDVRDVLLAFDIVDLAECFDQALVEGDEAGAFDGQIDDRPVSPRWVLEEFDAGDFGLAGWRARQHTAGALLDGGIFRPVERSKALDDQGVAFANRLEAEEVGVEVVRETLDLPWDGRIEAVHCPEVWVTGKRTWRSWTGSRGVGKARVNGVKFVWVGGTFVFVFRTCDCGVEAMQW